MFYDKNEHQTNEKAYEMYLGDESLGGSGLEWNLSNSES